MGEGLTEVSQIEKQRTLTATFRRLLGIREPDPHILGLYVGPPGSGRSVLCKQYAYELLRSGRKVIYMSTERSSRDIVERMSGHGWNVEPYLRSSLRLVDLYSWLEDGNQSYVETEFGSRLCPLNVADLQLAIAKLYNELGSGWSIVIFDSLSTIIATLGEEIALRMIPSVLAKIRQHGSAVVSLTSGIHPESTLNRLHSMFDLVVEMQIEANEEHLQRKLRVTKYTLGNHSDSWIPFRILDEGIILQTDVPMNIT